MLSRRTGASNLEVDNREHPDRPTDLESHRSNNSTRVAKQRHKHSNQDLDSLNDALNETPPPYPKTPHQRLNLEYTLSLVAATVIVYSWTWRWPRQMVCRDGVTLLTCSLESVAEKTEIMELCRRKPRDDHSVQLAAKCPTSGFEEKSKVKC